MDSTEGNLMSSAIIPVRDLANTKQRLSSLLDEEKRSILTRTLLEGVLIALDCSPIQNIVVVATDPNEIRPIAQMHQRILIIPESKNRGGVNGAMQDGIGYLESQGKLGEIIMMLPGDLPFLDKKSIEGALKKKEEFEVLIIGSRKKDGTSLLMLDPSKMIRLRYDDNSFLNHQVEAARQGLKVATHDDEAFSFDVDDEDDLSQLMKILSAKSFDQLISRLNELNLQKCSQ